MDSTPRWKHTVLATTGCYRATLLLSRHDHLSRKLRFREMTRVALNTGLRIAYECGHTVSTFARFDRGLTVSTFIGNKKEEGTS